MVLLMECNERDMNYYACQYVLQEKKVRQSDFLVLAKTKIESLRLVEVFVCKMSFFMIFIKCRYI